MENNLITKLKNIAYSSVLGDGALNTKEFMEIMLFIRLVVVGSLFWASWYLKMELGSKVWISFSAFYIFVIFLPFLLELKTPLIFLSFRFLSLLTVCEILALIILSAYFTSDEQAIFLSFIFPLMTLHRIKEWEFLSVIVASVVLVTACTLSVFVLGEAEARSHWFANLPILLIVFAGLQIWFWRYGKHTRHDLVQSNLKHAIEIIKIESQADISFLRIPFTLKNQPYLFLIATSPWEEFKNVFTPDMVAMHLDEESIVTEAFKTQKPVIARTRDQLMHYKVLKRFDLNFGMAIPLDSNAGLLSCYRKDLDFTDADMSYLLAPLSTYIENEEAYLHAWIDKRWERRLAPTAEWENIANFTEEIFKDTDFWSSSNMLVKESVEFSRAHGGFILVYDEGTELFEINDLGHGIVNIDPAILKQEKFLKSEVQNFVEANSRNDHCYSFQLQRSSLSKRYEQVIAFPLRTKESHESLQDWKWIGLLVLVFDRKHQIDLQKYRQLELIALNASSDLRNCQLHLKSETALSAQEALNEIIDQLFSADQISHDEQDFFKIAGRIIEKAFVDVHSCTLGSVSGEVPKINPKHWFTTITDDLADIRFDNSSRLKEVKSMVRRNGQVFLFDYSQNKNPYEEKALQQGVRESYGMATLLDKNTHAIIYINYPDKKPEHIYSTRKILSSLASPIAKAWKVWHQWFSLMEKEKVRQREFWRYEIHDQLNELQSNVMRPLELHKLRLQRAGLIKYAEATEKIHRGIRGVNATLKQINDDIRDPIFQEKGLIAALEYLKDPSRFGANIGVYVSSEYEPEPRISGPLYLIAREAVANAFKHGSRHVDLFLSCEPKSIVMQIIDSGPGYDGSQREGSGTGLMRYQAQLIGANIDWQVRTDTSGTILVVVRNELIEGSE